MDTPDRSIGEARFTIRRQHGETFCEACVAGSDAGTATLWLTAAKARHCGFTQCSRCGRVLVPGENPSSA
jgi:hypothetical protein